MVRGIAFLAFELLAHRFYIGDEIEARLGTSRQIAKIRVGIDTDHHRGLASQCAGGRIVCTGPSCDIREHHDEAAHGLFGLEHPDPAIASAINRRRRAGSDAGHQTDCGERVSYHGASPDRPGWVSAATSMRAMKGPIMPDAAW